MENPFTSTVTRRLKQRFRISRISRQMKETLISGKILLSLTCCTAHTSRRLGYIVPAIGPITRTAPTGATWKHSTGVIFGALGVMPGLAMEIRQRCNVAIPKELGFAIPHIYTAFGIPSSERSPLRCGAGNRRRPRFSDERERKARSRRKCVTSRITFRKPWRWK